jgi:N-acetylglucosaminyl-diphospho-decaprenol L-rhamnosyltransferase
MTSARPAVAVVVVHYQTPHLLPPAVRSVAAQLEKLSASWELVVVDNSGDAGDTEVEGARILGAERNLGYAGGVARGVESTRGELVIAMNPDVILLPGCLAPLVEVARRGAVAGPRFFWDRDRRLLLPPGEHRTLRSELVRALALRSHRFTAPARRLWRRHAREHWEARQPLATAALSGALLAFPRSVWEHVGPFDAGYPLYFEETDWLLRARALGVRAWHLPEAAAVHHFDQSGRREPGARALVRRLLPAIPRAALRSPGRARARAPGGARRSAGGSRAVAPSAAPGGPVLDGSVAPRAGLSGGGRARGSRRPTPGPCRPTCGAITLSSRWR